MYPKDTFWHTMVLLGALGMCVVILWGALKDQIDGFTSQPEVPAPILHEGGILELRTPERTTIWITRNYIHGYRAHRRGTLIVLTDADSLFGQRSLIVAHPPEQLTQVLGEGR